MIIISIIIETISLVNYFVFKSYTKLIISDDKICIEKYKSYGWAKPHFLDTINSYTYQIDELNNIEVKTKYIVITGNFVMNKELGNGKLSLDMLNKQIIKISQIRIPRIFAEEDKIISS